MKAIFISLFIILFLTSIWDGSGLGAQNVAITDDDSYTANTSAMLDVKSTTKGMLIPRLTTAQRTAIVTPATSLLVFDTSLGGYYYYNGTAWINLSSGSSSGLLWSYSSSNVYLTGASDKVGIGTSAPAHKLNVVDNITITDGTDGSFIDIQNQSNSIGVLSGLRFYNGTSATTYKGGIFYKDALSFGRGDLILANNSIGAAGNVTSSDARLTIKNSGGIEVKATSGAAANASLFHVLNATGDTIFAVYDGGVRINVYDDTLAKATGSKGGFAVGGYSPAKGTKTNDYLRITPDSIRMYIEEGAAKGTANKGGFAVGGFSPAKATPSDYFNVYGASSALIINPSQPRIFWYPLKEALLSGRVLVLSPDSVGTNSFSSGYQSRAKGNYSQAMGYACIARGLYSTSIGKESIASGEASFALGTEVTASGLNSTALGVWCQASGLNSMAMGALTISSGTSSVALGLAANASGENALAMGVWATAPGDKSIALGSSANSSGFESVAFGSNSNSTGDYAVSFGNGTASGNSAFSLGLGTNAQAYGSLVTGRYNVLSGSTTTWVDTDPLFVIGNGTNSSTRANAVTVLKNGDFGIGTTSPTNRLHVINSASTVTDNAYGGYFSSTAGTTSGTAYGIRSYSYAYGSSNSYAIYASATGGTTSGNEWAFYGVGNGYFSGNVGLGSTAPGSHKLYATSSATSVAGSTVAIDNSASAGIALTLENSSTTSSDAVMLVTQKGSTGDIAAFDSWHGTGSWDREFRFSNTGVGYCDGSWNATGADYAEYFPKSKESDVFATGDVISISNKGYFAETCNEEYSNRILGVVSSNPAIVGNSNMDSDNKNNVLVGLMGVVVTKVNIENGAIKVGDFITTSSTSGIAMRATKQGMVIGRALESYNEKKVGMIKVMVNPIWSGRNIE